MIALRFVEVPEEVVIIAEYDAILSQWECATGGQIFFMTALRFVDVPEEEVIIAEYDAILSQWERANFYNHLSNYTKESSVFVMD